MALIGPIIVFYFLSSPYSIEVPQKELESLNARFVWVPELGEEDIMGIVAEHAERAGVESIVIPAYWIMKEGLELSPTH